MGQPLTVKDFQQSVAEGKLKGVQCNICGHKQVDILIFCPKCGKSDFKVIEFSSTGRVLTYTIQQVAPEPYLKEVPYAWAIIELDDGVRVTGWVPRIRSSVELSIGQRVRLAQSSKLGMLFEKT